jgi:hypothetical protein
VLAVLVIAVGLACGCARGLAAVNPTASVRHGGALARLTRASGMCAAPWGITGLCHRPIAHGLVVRLVGFMFSNCAVIA